jgi:hypothetical protein
LTVKGGNRRNKLFFLIIKEVTRFYTTPKLKRVKGTSEKRDFSVLTAKLLPITRQAGFEPASLVYNTKYLFSTPFNPKNTEEQTQRGLFPKEVSRRDTIC